MLHLPAANAGYYRSKKVLFVLVNAASSEDSIAVSHMTSKRLPGSAMRFDFVGDEATLCSVDRVSSRLHLQQCYSLQCFLVVLHICALLGVHQNAAAVPTRNSRWHATYARPAMMMHCPQMILPTQCHCLAFDGAADCLYVLVSEYMYPVLPCYRM